LILLAAYLTFWNDYFINGVIPDKYQTTIYTIGFGALLSFIASFIGWFASGLSRVKGSIIYIFMLGVSLLLLLISAFCFLYMANFDDPAISLSKTLDKMIKIEYNKNENIANVIDKIQTNHFCCGIESHSDWTNSEWFKIQDEDEITRKKFEIPESCCQKPESRCNVSPQPSNIWAINGDSPLGCTKQLSLYFAERYFWLYISGFVLSVLTLLQIIVSCSFCRTLRADKSI
jgi:hypothetical protein